MVAMFSRSFSLFLSNPLKSMKTVSRSLIFLLLLSTGKLPESHISCTVYDSYTSNLRISNKPLQKEELQV